MNISTHIVKWAAEECERQKSGEMSVYNMVNAFSCFHRWQMNTGFKISEDVIKTLGFMVEPEKNTYYASGNNYRLTPVHFKDMSLALRPEFIERQMGTLVAFAEDFPDWLSPDVWYQKFQEIHPFIDGNGRVGSILWNYLNGTLENPLAPPDMFW